MKKLLWIIGYLILAAKLSVAASPKTIMLVLGSAEPQTLQNRIAVATRLYRTQPIQKIIVSGGCGAHGSGICEATTMQQGLVANGVEPDKIYKEENAKTTVQNYVFSRVLRDEYDQRIIQPNDTVFVVSDHWHAISVAARLQQYDAVVARFYIEGSIIPKATDKLDYVSIFNGQPDNEKFVLQGSWLTPEAVWTVNDTTYYLCNDLVYGTDADNSTFSLQKSVQALPFLSQLDTAHSRAFIDGGAYWWVRNNNSLLKVDKKSGEVLEERPWTNWIKGMPAGWKDGAFSTGLRWNDTLVLFANEKILVARVEKGGFVFVEEMVAGRYFTDWPFSWGNSNVAASMIDEVTGELVLFRNRERVRVAKNLRLTAKPEPVKMKWIADLEK